MTHWRQRVRLGHSAYQEPAFLLNEQRYTATALPIGTQKLQRQGIQSKTPLSKPFVRTWPTTQSPACAATSAIALVT